MLTDPWQIGLLAVLFTSNVAVSYWLYRRLRGPAGRSPPGLDREATASGSPLAEQSGEPAGRTATAERGRVTCPACGTANDAEFRFCRRCVAELSAPGVAGDGAGDRAGGLPR